MTFSRRLVRASALVGGIAMSGAFVQATPPPRIDAGERVEVEVKIVPFYAVDSQGRLVTDLKPEEVEIRVGGAPVAIESFLGHPSRSGGGLHPARIDARLEGSAPAPAYYEAGFRSAGGVATASKTPVEVAVRRPGVRVWAPSNLWIRRLMLKTPGGPARGLS